MDTQPQILQINMREIVEFEWKLESNFFLQPGISPTVFNTPPPNSTWYDQNTPGC